MKKLIIFILIIALAAILYLFFRNNSSLIEVKINSHLLDVEVADEQTEKELGLMNRETLDEEQGMLFVYEEAITPTFWMKDMLIPLDMIFISPDKKINHIEKKVPPCTQEDSEKCPTYTSPVPTQYILEVNSGYVDKNSIKAGDTLEFSL